MLRSIASRVSKSGLTTTQQVRFYARNPSIKYHNSEKAPKAIGPYSQAVECNGQVWVSGCLGIDPSTNEFSGNDTASQAKMALQNMKNVLEASGTSIENVVKTTVLLAEMSDFPVINEIYANFFGDTKPARACYACKTLPKNAKFEIEAIAVKPK
jgi:2-iminobutanoate/2-iminopropanoate deaminase